MEVDWAHKLQARTVGYDGAEVYSAERLDLERISVALPPAGVGGLVNAADVSTVFEREALLDPSLVLKTDAQEDERPPDPMLWASDADWQELAVVLVKRNICELTELTEIAEVNGRKVRSDGGGEGWQRSQHWPPASHHEQSRCPFGPNMSSVATCRSSLPVVNGGV